MNPFRSKILGSRCGSCRRLEENLRVAVKEADFPAEVEKLQEIEQFLADGIARIPALVINATVFA